MFNEIDGDFDEVTIRTFKVGLPSEYGLRKSLTGKPVTSLRQLMDRVDKYKRIEDDQQQGKLRLSLKKKEILGRTDTTIIGQEGIMQSSKGQITIKWSGLYFKSQCIKYWKKLRTNSSSNGPTRWWEILKNETETETSIVNIIGIMTIQQRSVGVYGIT